MKEDGNNNESYLAQPEGSTWCNDYCTPKENEARLDSIFDFDTYLVTGPFTFSSTNMLADAVKTFSLAKIVGEPTGEYTNDFGEQLRFTLPHSGIEVQTTVTFDYGADCDKKAKRTVAPDILLKPTLRQKIQGTDAVMTHKIALP